MVTVHGGCWRLALLLTIGLSVQRADAQTVLGGSPRAWCVTDPHGTPFCSWYGSPVAFNSYFYLSSNGASSSGYSTVNNGYYLGGVPAVASATTPEWMVQRTSVFPINSYYPWTTYSGTFAGPWTSTNRSRSSPINTQTESPDYAISSNELDALARLASHSVPGADEQGKQLLDEGDRLLREGQHTKAYLRYLAAQREVGDRGEVYFRQALALVAMGRHSHAVAKLKRGLQAEPDSLRPGASLKSTFGVDNGGKRSSDLDKSLNR